MAQFSSTLAIDFRTIAFPSSFDFDHFQSGGGGTFTSAELPNLEGIFSFDRIVALWSGSTFVSYAPDILAFVGTDSLSANSNGFPYSGTVTGVVIQQSYQPIYLVDTYASARSIHDAAMTASRTDDQAVIFGMLSGNDQFTLSSFADYVRSRSGQDVIRGLEGADTLLGEDGADNIYGGSDDDLLFGGAGGDRLYGEDGMDRLNGGAGSDRLSGGTDRLRDVFIFTDASHSAVGTARDIVSSFSRGIDDISLRRIDADTHLDGNQNFAFSGTTARAHAVWYETVTDGVIVRGDVTGDARADFEIKILGPDGIAATDFIL